MAVGEALLSQADDPTARAALERAIDENDQLVLVYQPIHDARSGDVRAAEALLRQRRSTGEIREASIITEAAEESEGPEIYVLDSLLVRKAYEEAARWQSRYDIRLHVNLSPREFEGGNVLERLSSLITSCGIDTQKLSVEITETHYIERPKETMHVLRALRELGLQLWLDDFGTGHSSLTHLQHFPLDGLKIPGAFIRPLPGDARCGAIVRAIAGLAKELDLALIAEEVETRAQLDFLLELGCELVQGFLFSKPMTAVEFEKVLSA